MAVDTTLISDSTMAVKDVLNYDSILKQLIDGDFNIPSTVKFKFLGMRKQYESVVANFEAIRNELIQKYGSEDKDGNIGIFAPDPDSYDSDDDFSAALEEYSKTAREFDEEINAVLDTDSELKLQKFKYTDLIDAHIPSDILLALFDLMEE